MGKRVSYVSGTRGMTTKLNGISELLALFPLSTALGRAVNHKAAGIVRLRYQRAHTSKSLPLVSADPTISVSHQLAHPGSPHPCARRRDGHTERTVPWFTRLPITLAALFALCRWLLITTYLTCHHHLRGSGSGTDKARKVIGNRVRIVILTGACARGRRVPGCL